MTAVETVELHHPLEGPGDAPVLVMANTLGTTLRMWEDQAPNLRERIRLLRYDHRGHGGSPLPPGPSYEIGDLGRDVLALLDSLGVGRFSFCGLSIGGLVGMWLASEAPERVERLVLCCTAARFAPPEQWQERARTVRAEGVGAIADAVLERWFTPSFHESRPGTVAWAGGMLRGTPAEGYAGCCEAVRDADLRGRLGTITAAPVDQAEPTSDSIPDSRLVVVEEAAHLANVERTESVTREILAHLDPVAGERR